MKRLIINADDLGADEARNAGIFEAIQAGAVTSASILPNGPGLLDALNRIHSGSFKNITWGVHLNLSEGKPISTGNSLLLEPDGTFRGKVFSQHLLMRQGDRDCSRDRCSDLSSQNIRYPPFSSRWPSARTCFSCYLKNYDCGCSKTSHPLDQNSQ